MRRYSEVIARCQSLRLGSVRLARALCDASLLRWTVVKVLHHTQKFKPVMSCSITV